MGALPKNKITRVERGKRRRGNTPKIVKDIKVAKIPPHKKGFAAAFFKAVGIDNK